MNFVDNGLETFEVPEGAVYVIKDKGEDIVAILFPGSHESSHVRLEADVQGHFPLGSLHLELHGRAGL